VFSTSVSNFYKTLLNVALMLQYSVGPSVAYLSVTYVLWLNGAS